MPQSSWQTALRNPINILTIIISITAGLISAWWLFPLGILFWFIMVLSMVNDPAFQIQQVIDRRSRLPNRFEGSYGQIEESQVKLIHFLASVHFQTRKGFQPLQNPVNNLVATTYQVCQQMAPLDDYVRANAASNPENELENLGRLMAIIEDPTARKGYDHARQSLIDKVNQLKFAKDRLARMETLLKDIQNDMEQILYETGRLRDSKPQDIRQQTISLVDVIHQRMDELIALKKLLIKKNPDETRASE